VRFRLFSMVGFLKFLFPLLGQTSPGGGKLRGVQMGSSILQGLKR